MFNTETARLCNEVHMLRKEKVYLFESKLQDKNLIKKFN